MYHFLVKTQTSIRAQGKRYDFRSVGEVVAFEDSVGQMIHDKQIPGSEYLSLVSIDPKPQSKAADNFAQDIRPGLEQEGVVVGSDQSSDQKVVQPSNDSKDPSESLSLDDAETESLAVPEGKLNSESTEAPDENMAANLPEVPLVEGEHWSTVKSFLVKMGEAGNFDMVRAVKAKFSYKIIQEEADEILANAGLN